MHCPTRVKNDGNVRGTRITNTGLHDMGGILSLNKRGPAAVPGSPDHNGEPLVTVVVLKSGLSERREVRLHKLCVLAARTLR